MTSLARQRFFSNQVYMPAWKESMAGKNEDRVINLLENMGYELDKDFVRQHPLGEKFVIDIAFVNEQIAIEIDGKNHQNKKQRSLDKKRDKYLHMINWVPIRIADKDLFGSKGSFYKSLIKLYIEERREQWTIGTLYPINYKNYVEGDY